MHFTGGSKEAFLLKQQKDQAKAEAAYAREQERLRKVKAGLIPDDPPTPPPPAAAGASHSHAGHRRREIRDDDNVSEVSVRVRHEDAAAHKVAPQYRVLDLDKLALMQDASTTARLPAALLDQLVYCTLEVEIQGHMCPIVVYDEDVDYPSRALDRVIREHGFILVKEDIYKATRKIREKIDKTRLAAWLKANPSDNRVPWPNRHLYMPVAFYCLTLESPLRLAAISACEWTWWSRGVLTLILINSLMLTLEDPFDDPPSSELGKLLETMSTIFSVVFTIETVVRMLALGLWGHHNGFFHSSWNNMGITRTDASTHTHSIHTLTRLHAHTLIHAHTTDLAIVLAGLMELGGSSSVKFSMLRTLRVLRPLRSITRIPSLRLLITTIIQAWRPLSCAVLVTGVLTTSLGIVGVASFQGKLRNRCYSIRTGLATATTRRCDIGSNGPRMLLKGAFTCPYGEQCLPLGLPLPGEPVASFDNIFDASLSVFRIMLLDNWRNIMFDTADATSVLSILFFLLVVMGGPCFATNLFLAVLTQRLKDLSNVEVITVLKAGVCKWSHPLEARAFGKWSMHWQAGQQALEMTILSKLDATRMDIYAAVLERMGFEKGVLLGRSKAKAFMHWKSTSAETKAAKQAELRRLQLQHEYSKLQQMQDEAGGRNKNRESVLTACSNHLNLLKFQMKTALMNFVLSNGLEHAVIQAVIVSTILQAMEHDPESKLIFGPSSSLPLSIPYLLPRHSHLV